MIRANRPGSVFNGSLPLISHGSFLGGFLSKFLFLFLSKSHTGGSYSRGSYLGVTSERRLCQPYAALLMAVPLNPSSKNSAVGEIQRECCTSSCFLLETPTHGLLIFRKLANASSVCSATNSVQLTRTPDQKSRQKPAELMGGSLIPWCLLVRLGSL